MQEQKKGQDSTLCDIPAIAVLNNRLADIYFKPLCFDFFLHKLDSYKYMYMYNMYMKNIIVYIIFVLYFRIYINTCINFIHGASGKESA